MPRPRRLVSRSPRIRRSTALLAVAIAALVLTACGGGGSKLATGASASPSGSASTTQPTATSAAGQLPRVIPTATLPPQKAISITFAPVAQSAAGLPAVAAYRQYVAARQAALVALNGYYGPLALNASGAALVYTRNQIAYNKAHDLVIVGAPRWSIVGVRNPSPTEVDLLGCELDSSIYFVNRATGKPNQVLTNRWIPALHHLAYVGTRWVVTQTDWYATLSCKDAQ